MEKSKGSICVDSDALPRERLHIFISYSRVDSEFAYRLRADLEVSGFSVWIDTAKLGAEGGQEWLRIIQDAVDSCQAILVIVSPDSVQSRYVRMEYHYAQTQKKLVIPLHYRTVSSVPIDLSLDQWIEFREGQGKENVYTTGLSNVIQSLSKAPIPPKFVTIPQTHPSTPSPLAIDEGTDVPEFGPVPPAPPTPAPDIQELIAGVYDARGRHDLAGEEYFLQKVVESGDPAISHSFATRLKDVSKQREIQRVKGLQELANDAVSHQQWRRALGAWQALLSMSPTDVSAQQGIRQARKERANEALQDGEFDEAIGAWQALLKSDLSSSAAQAGLRSALRARAADAWRRADWNRAAESWETLRALTPSEPFAERYLQAIAQNRQQTFVYEMVKGLHQAGNAAAARAALEDLYSTSPYYGDPAGVAAELRVVLPETLAHELELQQRKAAEAEQQRKAAEAEQQRKAAEEAAEKAIQDRDKAAFGCFSLVFITIPGDVLGVAVVASARAGIWWTGQMLQGFLLLTGFWVVSIILIYIQDWYLFDFLEVGSEVVRYRIRILALAVVAPVSWMVTFGLFQMSFSFANFVFIVSAALLGHFAALIVSAVVRTKNGKRQVADKALG